MNFKKILPFIILILFFILAFFYFAKNNTSVVKNDIYNTKYVKIANTTLAVNLAINKEQQEQGLSGEKSIKDTEGLLFIFEKSGIYNFWMKDMNFPIDIIWINEDFKIVHMEKNVMPSTYPETFSSKGQAQYVLEVEANFCEKNNLVENEIVFFLAKNR